MYKHTFISGLLVAAAIVSTYTTARAAFGDITLIGHVDKPGNGEFADCWGYYDPNTGKEYAIVGDWVLNQVHLIDVTDPFNPSITSTILNMPGFDVKTWGTYIYSCDGGFNGLSSRIADISNPAAPVLTATLMPITHNITISPGGNMFFSWPGMRTYEVQSSPTAPVARWTDNLGTSNGHDVTVKGNLAFDFMGYNQTCRVLDISDPTTQNVLYSVADGNVSYMHSGDTDVSGDYLYACDELATGTQADLRVYDISAAPTWSQVATLNRSATIHNLYIVGDLAFISYYKDGFVTLDVTNPASPVTADAYDTSPAAGESYDAGAWGVYPYAQTGFIYISDITTGLWVFRVEGHNGTVVDAREPAPLAVTLHQNHPNPFNPSTVVDFELVRAGDARLTVHDVSGRLIRTLHEGWASAGQHTITWNGTNDNDRLVASGVYYCRLESAGAVRTMRMVLLK